MLSMLVRKEKVVFDSKPLIMIFACAINMLSTVGLVIYSLFT